MNDTRQDVWKVTLTYPTANPGVKTLGPGSILGAIRGVAKFLGFPMDIKVEAIVAETDYKCVPHSVAGRRS